MWGGGADGGPVRPPLEKHVIAALGGHDLGLKVRWMFSPDVHQSINPSLVDSQSSHCHISTPAKAFRNKSSRAEVGGGAE